MWRNGALTHKHFQMAVKGNFANLVVLNKKIKVCLGWDERPPTSCVVSCKKLRDEGLHTFKGVIGYCMKDNGEESFEFVHHNISAEDMNDGKLEYVKLGKVGLNNRVSLPHSDVLQRAHQRVRFHMTKHLGVALPGTLYHMCKNGQFYPNPTWVILLRSTGIDVERVASTWKIVMNPHDIQMEDIPDVVFDTITGESNMRYFNAQQIAIDNREEEREINCASRKDIVVKGDGIDPKLKDLERTWVAEDA